MTMSRLEVLKSLAVGNQTKMVLLVMDGLGGLPGPEGRTELEKAWTPNLDELAASGETGLLEIVDTGITPGSGPGHLGLFGYNPLEFSIGRGILEALGIGAQVKKGEICARGNFATWKEQDVILDRRAGRIDTETSGELVEKLSRSISEIDGVKVRFYPGLEHRFVVVLSGEDLSENVSDADPQVEGKPMKWSEATAPEGQKTAKTVNALIREVRKVLSGEDKANGCLLRGFSGVPDIPQMRDLYGIHPLAVASYPMYRGLASLVGMEVAEPARDLPDLVEIVKSQWDASDYFFVHVKYTDSRGEDGDFDAKVDVIEQVDRLLPDLLELRPDVIAVTGDHSTPAKLASHSWHPSPMLLKSSFVRTDDSEAFSERACARGSLGNIPAFKLMGLMLAHARRLAKYGA
ncbi:MAG: 2,3-bisphosphoglycerate-independent phosphoglycerate mutase [Thermovirgaceae bacterium]